MDFISFTGHKRTAESFLNKIKDISTSQNSLYEHLGSLGIFESYTPVKNRIALEESSNSVKMKISSKGTRSVSVNLPNILGNGEFVSIDASGLKDVSLSLGKPIFFNNRLFNSKISLVKTKKNINDKDIEIKRAEVSARAGLSTAKIGTERIQKLDMFYSQYIFDFLGARIDSKMGFTKTDQIIPFCRVILSRTLGLEGKRLFCESSLRAGKIFGQTNLTEKFFLGESLRGYQSSSIGPVNQNKKMGGNSFIEVKSRVGVFVKSLELYAFADVGVNSVKGLKECGEMLARFGDNNCIGKSVGVGVSLKNKKGPSFIFAVPFTSNPEAERYSFGIDFEF